MVSTYICILTKPTRKLYLLRDIVFICSLTFRILILALQLDYLLTLKVKPHKSVGFLLSILRTPPPPTQKPLFPTRNIFALFTNLGIVTSIFRLGICGSRKYINEISGKISVLQSSAKSS
jgi:hypothetical protein